MFVISTLFMVSCSPSPRFSSRISNVEKQKQELTEIPHKLKQTKRNFKTNNIKPIAKFPKVENNFDYLVFESAKEWLGTPYKWGGDSKNGVDCSAFVKNVMKTVGVDLPRTAINQFEFSSSISLRNAKIGDLVFFRKSNQVSHVGIYLGKNRFIHSSTSKGVIISSLDDSWYQDNFYSVGRVKF
ncbi:C40 family peptidase [Candidatus Kapabacteria bacterium]|nr:C40 family peptidase [Candidatus Kapabacteria bacterium]